jgi:NTP pyrophosphatase (non-canonical NTP hydrolase)
VSGNRSLFPFAPRSVAERRMFPGQGSIAAEICLERDRQDAKWGGQPGVDRVDDHTYAAVLGEEHGECCKAWLERDLDGLRRELVQVAAVAVAWIEEIDNLAPAATREERNETASLAIKTADHFGVDGADTRV